MRQVCRCQDSFCYSNAACKSQAERQHKMSKRDKKETTKRQEKDQVIALVAPYTGFQGNQQAEDEWSPMVGFLLSTSARVDTDAPALFKPTRRCMVSFVRSISLPSPFARLMTSVLVLALLAAACAFIGTPQPAHAASLNAMQKPGTVVQASRLSPASVVVPAVSGCYYVTINQVTYPPASTSYDYVTRYLFGYYNNVTNAPCGYMFTSAWLCRPAYINGTGTLTASTYDPNTGAYSQGSRTVGPNTSGSQQCYSVNNINQPLATRCSRGYGEYYIVGSEDIVAPKNNFTVYCY